MSIDIGTDCINIAVMSPCRWKGCPLQKALTNLESAEVYLAGWHGILVLSCSLFEGLQSFYADAKGRI